MASGERVDRTGSLAMTGAPRRVAAAMATHPWRIVAMFAAVAASARFAATFGHPVPWIFGDEFIYVENARNFANHGTFTVRDQPLYLSLVATLLEAPGFLLFGDTESAYVWIKAINSVAMASAAFPAYGLARMVLSRRVALLFSALVLAWPAFAYVDVVMTEPFYLPAMLLAVWMLARAVERPSLARQAAAMGAVGLCIAVRLQLVALLVAVPVICGVAALRGADRERGRLARVRELWPLFAFSVALPAIAAVVQAIRGKPVRGLLGGYENNDAGRVDVGEALPWLVRHVAVVALAVAIVPAAIAVSAAVRYLRRGATPSQSGVFAAVLVVVPLLVAQVAIYASVYSLRVVERNLFVVEPLLVLLALAGICAIGYGRVLAIAVACALAAALVALPVADLLRPPPFSDTFSLLVLMRLGHYLHVSPANLLWPLAIAGVGLTVAAALGPPRRVLPGLAAVLLPLLAWGSFEVTRLVRDYSANVANVLQPRPFDWVDRAVGPAGRVALLWPADDTPVWAWEHEIWNRSLRSVAAIDGAMPVLDTLNGTFSPETGEYVPLAAQRPPPESLVLAPSRWQLRGEPVARGRTAAISLTVWRIAPPLRLAFQTSGVYADGWTGSRTVLRAFGCRPGAFSVGLLRGFGASQQVVASASGRPPLTVTLDSDRVRRFTFPAAPDPSGTCTLTLDMRQTATGDEIAGNGDTRVLGVIIQAPRYVPARAPRA